MRGPKAQGYTFTPNLRKSPLYYLLRKYIHSTRCLCLLSAWFLWNPRAGEHNIWFSSLRVVLPQGTLVAYVRSAWCGGPPRARMVPLNRFVSIKYWLKCIHEIGFQWLSSVYRFSVNWKCQSGNSFQSFQAREISFSIVLLTILLCPQVTQNSEL